MSERVGNLITCEQCEDITLLVPGTHEEMLDQLAKIGWKPYGTGVTPFAQENAKAGMFTCPRCTNELIDQRLNRLAREVINALGISYGWLVIRSAESSSDFLRILKPDQSVQLEFEHRKTDREMREVLRASLVAALGLGIA